MPQKLCASSNESDILITISIESETPHSSEILQVRLASVHWHADDTNSPGHQADASKGQVDTLSGEADVLRGWADIPDMLNHAEMAMLGHRDNLSTHLIRKTNNAIDHYLCNKCNNHIMASIPYPPYL